VGDDQSWATSDDPETVAKALGRIGYEAYGREADWKAYNGEPMPTWDDLPDHIHRKWSAAAKGILDAIADAF
jgi:hypothetical protein